MTQAFNLSQLGNGVNTSGQVNAAQYLYNQTPVANGGTNLSTLTASGNMLLATSATTMASVAVPAFAYKNKFINGAMMIDQRNLGAVVTPVNGAFTLDRWQAALSQPSKFSIQQVTTAPAGFSASLKVTSLSSYSVGASESFRFSQPIEGYNIVDLGWGTANAQPATLSFRVYSSLTGTFGGSITDSVTAYSYPFSYVVSVANTWTTIAITIAGPTSGTWGSTNNLGLSASFSLGAGATVSGTAGAWVSGFYASTTGAVSVVGTSGATLYITGIQLEKGSIATSFDYRAYGTESSLSYRYYIKYTGGLFLNHGAGYVGNSTTAYAFKTFPVVMRSTPTFNSSGTFVVTPGITFSSLAIDAGATSIYGGNIQINGSGGVTSSAVAILSNNSTTTYTEWNAEF